MKSPEKLCRTVIMTSKEGAVHIWYKCIRRSEKGPHGAETQTLKEGCQDGVGVSQGLDPHPPPQHHEISSTLTASATLGGTLPCQPSGWTSPFQLPLPISSAAPPIRQLIFLRTSPICLAGGTTIAIFPTFFFTDPIHL